MQKMTAQRMTMQKIPTGKIQILTSDAQRVKNEVDKALSQFDSKKSFIENNKRYGTEAFGGYKMVGEKLEECREMLRDLSSRMDRKINKHPDTLYLSTKRRNIDTLLRNVERCSTNLEDLLADQSYPLESSQCQCFIFHPVHMVKNFVFDRQLSHTLFKLVVVFGWFAAPVTALTLWGQMGHDFEKIAAWIWMLVGIFGLCNLYLIGFPLYKLWTEPTVNLNRAYKKVNADFKQLVQQGQPIYSEEMLEERDLEEGERDEETDSEEDAALRPLLSSPPPITLSAEHQDELFIRVLGSLVGASYQPPNPGAITHNYGSINNKDNNNDSN